MTPKCKMLLGTLAVYAALAAGAQAQIVIQPVINAAPAPVYAPPPPPPYYYNTAPVITTYDPHHRRHDYEYWRAHHHEEHDPRFDHR